MATDRKVMKTGSSRNSTRLSSRKATRSPKLPSAYGLGSSGGCGAAGGSESRAIGHQTEQ